MRRVDWGLADVVKRPGDGDGRSVAIPIVVVIVVAVSVFMFVAAMSVTITHLVASEILKASGTVMLIKVFAAMRVFAVITVAAIVVPIDVTPEVAVATKPWTSAEKNAVWEPLRSVVAIRGAIVGRVIEVAVGTHGRWTDLDCNLCLGFRRRP